MTEYVKKNRNRIIVEQKLFRLLENEGLYGYIMKLNG